MPLPGSFTLPAHSAFPPAAPSLAESSVDEALERVGFERSALAWRALHLAPGAAIALPQDRSRAGMDWRVIETPSLAEFKRWIGFDDTAIREGSLRAAAVDLSGIESPESLRLRPESEAARATLEKVAAAFLFGDSERVAPYRDAIELNYGPFRAQLIVAGSIVLDRGSALRIEQMPAVLIADELILRGGALFVSPVTHCTIGRLVKEGE